MTSTVKRAPGRSQPIWTIRGTPAAVAASITAWMSGAGLPSRERSRWVWLSTTAMGSGSGAGGLSRPESLTSFAVAVRHKPRELLLDHRRVELGEDGGRFGDRGAGRDGAGLPSRRARVVTGDDQVALPAVQVVDLVDARHGRDLSQATHRGVNLVAAVRQEGTQQGRAVADRLGEHMQDRAEPLAFVIGLELERRLVGDVLVDLGHHAHGLGERLLLTVTLDQGPDGREALVDRRQKSHVLGCQLGRSRDLAKAPVNHRGRAVDQVAPPSDELTVGAPDELGPGEVAVLVLRAGCRDEVPEGIGLIALKDVADVDHHAAAGGELLALHREELRADHLGRQLELAKPSGSSAPVPQ